jgi:hypothetical protein
MTGMIGWAELMVVAAIPALIGGEVGVVLLVIGLVKRRKGLWVGGLATLIISVLLLVSMAGFALLVFAGSGRRIPAAAPSPPATTSPAPVGRGWMGGAAGQPSWQGWPK